MKIRGMWGIVFLLLGSMHFFLKARSLGIENTTPFNVMVEYEDALGKKKQLRLSSREKKTIQHIKKNDRNPVATINTIMPVDVNVGVRLQAGHIDVLGTTIPVFDSKNKSAHMRVCSYAFSQARDLSDRSVVYIRIVLDASKKNIMLESTI